MKKGSKQETIKDAASNHSAKIRRGNETAEKESYETEKNTSANPPKRGRGRWGSNSSDNSISNRSGSGSKSFIPTLDQIIEDTSKRQPIDHAALFDRLDANLAKVCIFNLFTRLAEINDTRSDDESKKTDRSSSQSEAEDSMKNMTLKYFFPPQIKQHRKHRGSIKRATTPFDIEFDKWEHAAGSKSYSINPYPFKFSDEPCICDFVCNPKYKALAAGSEGVQENLNEEDAITSYIQAQHQHSADFDELGIEHVKVENFFRIIAKRENGYSSEQLVEMARKRTYIETRIRRYNDDIVQKYRPLKKFDIHNISESMFPEIGSKDLYFMCFMIHLIEINTLLSPHHATPISNVLYELIPIILASKKLYLIDLPFNILLAQNQMGFLYKFVQALERLNEYFHGPDFICLRATFDIMVHNKPENTIVFKKEMTRIKRNIENGASLSQIFYELRNEAIGIISSKSINSFKSIRQMYKTNGKKPRLLKEILKTTRFGIGNPNIYFIKFNWAKSTSFTVKLYVPTDKQIAILTEPRYVPHTFHGYPLFNFLPKYENDSNKSNDENGPIYQIGNLSFALPPFASDIEMSPIIDFQTNTSLSLINLKEEDI